MWMLQRGPLPCCRLQGQPQPLPHSHDGGSVIKRRGWPIDLLIQRQQSVQRGRLDRHSRERLPPRRATLLSRRHVVPPRHPAQQLMQSTRQRDLITIALMSQHESIEFKQHLLAFVQHTPMPSP